MYKCWVNIVLILYGNSYKTGKSIKNVSIFAFWFYFTLCAQGKSYYVLFLISERIK